jgi:iron complex transport system ATP-binding protein
MMDFELRRVSFSRPGGRKVLSDLNLDIGKGSRLAILGPNGAGKTTLLALLGRRLSPDSGSILFEGQDLERYPSSKLARRLAFLPQIERIAFNYTVREFVLMGRVSHVAALAMPSRQEEDAALSAISELGIGSLSERPVNAISGGEFQLARIARCLAQGADTLLLDEPSSLLDPANARRVGKELAALAAGSRTIVFATHDIGLAAFLSDRVLLLRQGGIPLEGCPGEMLAAGLLSEAFGVDFHASTLPSAYPPLQ